MTRDVDDFDRVIARLDPAMVVVTAASHGERAGCLVGFHSQSSIEPRHYCVWISKANHTCEVVRRAGAFAVHILGKGDRDVAELFGSESGDDLDKFSRCDFMDHEAGPPLLTGCANRLVLERTGITGDGGDHVCLTGRLVEASFDGEIPTPLRLSDVADLAPGHRPDG